VIGADFFLFQPYRTAGATSSGTLLFFWQKFRNLSNSFSPPPADIIKLDLTPQTTTTNGFLLSFLAHGSEKSIIKTLESQQQQFMEEKRRRAERNENILRTLERIDYQAQLLATKSERLRALKVNI
jgi:hypothetical protein